MFERFTEKALKVVMLAQEEARRLGHNFVGSESLLLGLVGQGTGVAAKTLREIGVSLKDARVENEKIIGRGSGFVGVEIPFTPRARRVLSLSWDEARQLGDDFIDTQHLLLAITRDGEGVGVKILENLGVDVSKIRSHVINMILENKTALEPPALSGGSSVSKLSMTDLIENELLKQYKYTIGGIAYMLEGSRLTGKALDLEITRLVKKFIV